MVAAPAEGRKRPRGFIRAWEPRPATRQLLGAVQRVLDEYRAHLPLTVRQIYYRLVATGKLEKTERAYGRLVEHLTLARRAEFVAFEYIRDDGADLPGSLVGSSDPGDLAGLLAAVARDFALDPQTGQARRLLLWCEAGGMRPQLERVAAPYGVQVVAGGGFDSLTAKHAMAELMTDADAAFEVLHVGDFDPSGEHVFASLAEDVEEFALALGADVAFTRLARRDTGAGRPLRPAHGAAEAVRPAQLLRRRQDRPGRGAPARRAGRHRRGRYPRAAGPWARCRGRATERADSRRCRGAAPGLRAMAMTASANTRSAAEQGASPGEVRRPGAGLGKTDG
jgi:hypothetical protein